MDNEKKKILIVEDDKPLLGALKIKFESEGFYVLTAVNGEEGLHSALENHPDIILLDIIMPIMDGITMMEKMREDEWGKSAKIIILTNLSDSESVTNALQGGVYTFLVKSDWEIDAVVSKVRSML